MLQVVCLSWGTKYGPEVINYLQAEAVRLSSRPVRFVCITDAPRDLHADIVQKQFPAFALPFEEMKFGCRAKLAMFAPGMLEPDLPTVYLDLDTALLGDPAKLVVELERHRGMFMLMNHYVQWWKLPKAIKKLAGSRYYFGNSSILAFYPGEMEHIYTRFNEEIARVAGEPPKRLASDERFISYSNRDNLRVFPTSLANKFAEEYMMPLPWMEDIRKRLPWVKARRDGLVAMTFVSEGLKSDRLIAFKTGDLLRYKRASVYWNEADHGRYSDYFRRANGAQEQAGSVSQAA